MLCPFCQHANAATAFACRVCGAPLGAKKPVIAPIFVAPNPTEIARHTFAEAASAPICAHFFDDETSLVWFIRENGDLQMWNAQTDALHTFSVSARRWFRRNSALSCAALAFKWSATGHENGAVRFDEFDNRERKNPASHVGRVTALAFNATHLYSGGSDGVIWATALERNEKSRALIEGLAAMTTFAAAPDASSIAVGRDDGAVQLWRLNAEQSAAKLDWTRHEHGAPIASLSFSPKGQMIISRDRNGALGLWAAQTSYQLPLPVGAQSSAVAPAFSGDNRLLALASSGKAAIYDVALGTLVSELPPFGEPITHLAFASASPWLLLASARQIAVWNFV